jgi:Secretion system C-terminal sorting domain
MGATQICIAQEQVASVFANQALLHAKLPAKAKKMRAINLPFVDDFSKPGPYPDPAKWLDNEVFINNTFGIDVVTQGVASFDALNAAGRSYHANGIPSSYNADSLTSQQINMGSLQAADSVYLSFFIQPQGNGFQPDAFDSIKLFLLTSSNTWIQVWAKGGAPYTAFQQIMIPITSNLFFHNAFQFRFVNTASPNSNDDVWNLDYVRLAKNRSKTDTVLNDIAFALAPSYIMADYTSLPYRHFRNYTGTEQASSFYNQVQNNYKVANTVGVNVEATELNTNSVLHNAIVNVTVPPGLASTATYPQYAITYNPALANADVTIRHKYYYNKLNALENTANDTIICDNVFSQYFAYDDGSNEKAYYLLGIANTPSSTALGFHFNEADTLRGLAIRFASQVPSGEGKPFSINVYKSLGANSATQSLIYTQQNCKVIYTNSIDQFTTYQLDTLLALPAGDYFIGTTQAPNIGADSIYFGLDANTTANLIHFYYNVDGNWTPSIVNGTTMMRPLVGSRFTPTSIAHFSIKSNISLYPNPTNAVLQLLDNQAAIRYGIINAVGNTVQCNALENDKINVQQLPAGQYFLQLFNAQHQIIQHIPFIKQ